MRRLYARVLRAYARRCESNALGFQQPSVFRSHTEGDVAVLENERGTLARFRMRKNRLADITDD